MKRKSLGFTFILIFFSLNVGAFEKLSDFNNNFYTGSPIYSGNTCVSCHNTHSDKAVFNVLPKEMLEDGANGRFFYEPSTAYTFVISMNAAEENPEGSNGQNGFVMQIVDSAGNSVGTYAVDSTTQTDEGGSVVLDSDDPTGLATKWQFQWQSPAIGGPLILYFAGVDGNGDSMDGSADRTDSGAVQLVTSDVTETQGFGCGLATSRANHSFFFLIVLSAMCLLYFRSYHN